MVSIRDAVTDACRYSGEPAASDVSRAVIVMMEGGTWE